MSFKTSCFNNMLTLFTRNLYCEQLILENSKTTPSNSVTEELTSQENGWQPAIVREKCVFPNQLESGCWRHREVPKPQLSDCFGHLQPHSHVVCIEDANLSAETHHLLSKL